jgi:hypothetical protein
MAGDHVFALISMTGLYGVRVLAHQIAQPGENSRILRGASAPRSVDACIAKRVFQRCVRIVGGHRSEMSLGGQ